MTVRYVMTKHGKRTHLVYPSEIFTLCGYKADREVDAVVFPATLCDLCQLRREQHEGR